MHDKKELCEKIVALYPDIGACGIDVTVDYDEEKKAWAVNLKKSGQTLVHYLENTDADHCIEGKECVSLGLEIAQMKKNIEGQQY